MSTEDLENITTRLDELTNLQKKQTDSIKKLKTISLTSQVLLLLVMLASMVQMYSIVELSGVSHRHYWEFGEYTRVGNQNDDVARNIIIERKLDFLLSLMKPNKDEKSLSQ